MTLNNILKYIAENKDALSMIIATIVGLAGLGTFIKAIIEYRLQGRQKRAELFDKYKSVLKSDQRIIQVAQYLENDDPSLANIPLLDRYYFLGFYEQLAITVNSKLIKKDVAHYMFSYFALRCWESNNFWIGINKNSYYWSVFKNYVRIMQKIEHRQLNKSIIGQYLYMLMGQREFKY